MNNGFSAFMILLVLIISALLIINLISRCSEENGTYYTAEPVNQPDGQQASSTDKTDSTTTGQISSCLIINGIEHTGKAYTCNIMAVNNSSESRQYRVHAEVQRQKPHKAFLSLFDIGEHNLGLLRPGEQRQLKISIPELVREKKSNYRIYLQLTDIKESSELFIDDAMREF